MCISVMNSEYLEAHQKTYCVFIGLFLVVVVAADPQLLTYVMDL